MLCLVNWCLSTSACFALHAFSRLSPVFFQNILRALREPVEHYRDLKFDGNVLISGARKQQTLPGQSEQTVMRSTEVMRSSDGSDDEDGFLLDVVRDFQASEVPSSVSSTSQGQRPVELPGSAVEDAARVANSQLLGLLRNSFGHSSPSDSASISVTPAHPGAGERYPHEHKARLNSSSNVGHRAAGATSLKCIMV